MMLKLELKTIEKDDKGKEIGFGGYRMCNGRTRVAVDAGLGPWSLEEEKFALLPKETQALFKVIKVKQVDPKAEKPEEGTSKK